MSEAKNKCQLDGCSRAASTKCFCCSKNVCTRHFTEHIDAVKAQIDPLANDINTMVETIQGLIVEQISDPCFAELHQWRCDMYQLIDEIFSVKSKEMEDLIEKNKNKFVEHKKQQLDTMIKIQDDVKQLVDDGDATSEQIQSLKNRLTGVETSLANFKKDFLVVNVRVFAQGLVTVTSNLNKLPPPPPQTPRANPSVVQPNLIFGAPTPISVHPNVAAIPLAAPKFSFSGLQQVPTTCAPGTTTSPFAFGITAPTAATASYIPTSALGGTPVVATSPFGSSGFNFASPSPPNSNQPTFNMQPHQLFGKGNKK